MRLLIFKVVDNLPAKLGVINPASPDAVAVLAFGDILSVLWFVERYKYFFLKNFNFDTKFVRAIDHSSDNLI